VCVFVCVRAHACEKNTSCIVCACACACVCMCLCVCVCARAYARVCVSGCAWERIICWSASDFWRAAPPRVLILYIYIYMDIHTYMYIYIHMYMYPNTNL